MCPHLNRSTGQALANRLSASSGTCASSGKAMEQAQQARWSATTSSSWGGGYIHD